MDTMEALLTRRSIRKYRPEPVPVEDLKEILAAGATAPSAVNMQHWYFVAVQDPAALEEVKAIMGGVVEKSPPLRLPERKGRDFSISLATSASLEMATLCIASTYSRHPASCPLMTRKAAIASR